MLRELKVAAALIVFVAEGRHKSIPFDGPAWRAAKVHPISWRLPTACCPDPCSPCCSSSLLVSWLASARGAS
jgi:hypothetical protein